MAEAKCCHIKLCRRWLTSTTVLLIIGNLLVSGFSCNPKCKCIWRNGKQTVECPNLSFTEIPPGMDSGSQVINLTGNAIRYLQRDAFLQAGLVNLQKIYLSHCGIEQVDEFAFNHLRNIVDLDLANNRISIVPSPAFRHLSRLRNLILSGNSISSVSSKAFSDLKELSVLEMSSCRIENIAVGSFEGLEKLRVLRIDGNQLQTLSGKVMIPVSNLHGISLDGNPWNCDCKLRSLREWLDAHNIPHVSPMCHKPARLREEQWDKVAVEEYSCPPIFLNTSSVVSVFETSNVTLDCRILADPMPDVEWTWRDRIIANLSEGISSKQMFIIGENGENEKLSKLTITSVQESNGGSYTCTAVNNAGKVSKNFTLMVTRRPITELKRGEELIEEKKIEEVRQQEAVEDRSQAADKSNVIGMIVGIVVGAVAVLLLFGVVLWLCRGQRRRLAQGKRVDSNHKLANSVMGPLGIKSNPHIPLDQQDSEADFKLLASVNSVQKPPRLGNYECLISSDMDGYDPLNGMGMDSLGASGVWVVKDHIPSDTEWDEEKNGTLRSSFSDKRNTINRTSIPVPMPLPPEDMRRSFHNEMTETLRRKNDKRMMERERGDGSSELEAVAFEDTSTSNGIPRGLQYTSPFEMLGVRDLEKTSVPGGFSMGEDCDNMATLKRRSSLLRGYDDQQQPLRTPDVVDQTLKPQSRSSPLTCMDESKQGMQNGVWDSFDHPSAYYRTPQVPNSNLEETGSDGTEV